MGRSPITTRRPCKTYGHEKRALNISKEGYRTLSTELEYKVSGRNMTWNILLLPYTIPGFFMVMRCPKPSYHFTLQQESADLRGEATLTISDLLSDSEMYVGMRRIVPGQMMVLSPGRQELSARKGQVLTPVGEIRLEADTDYLIGLEAHDTRD